MKAPATIKWSPLNPRQIPRSNIANHDRLISTSTKPFEHLPSGGAEWRDHENWLDENQDFAANYFTRKATSKIIENWIIANSNFETAEKDETELEDGHTFCNSKLRVYSLKYEAETTLKPLFILIDGVPSFFTDLPLETRSSIKLVPPIEKTKLNLNQTIGRNMIFELTREILLPLKVEVMWYKIIQGLILLSGATRGSIFVIRDCMGVDGPEKCLVGKFYNLSLLTTFEDAEMQEEVFIMKGTGIVGYSAETGQTVNIPDAYADARFDNQYDVRVGFRTKSLLCMPIRNKNDEIIAIAEVGNKKDAVQFTQDDERILGAFLKFCSANSTNEILYDRLQFDLERSKALNESSFILFQEQSTIERVIYRMLSNLKTFLSCERVQIILFQDIKTRVFSRVYCYDGRDKKPRNFPLNYGFSGYVASTGKTLNIPDAYESILFDPEVDANNSNFKHKSILCVAVNSNGKIIGVMELVNKCYDGEEAFSANDQSFVESYAILCGLAIANTKYFMEKSQDIDKYQFVIKELSYHKIPPYQEVRRLVNLKVPHSEHMDIQDFAFDNANLNDDGTLLVCVRLFKEFDFMDHFKINYENLCQWLLTIKASHRDVKYHNWRHSVSMSQMMYVMLAHTKWYELFGSVECIGLIIACLCHELDHLPYDSRHQKVKISPLAGLSSTWLRENQECTLCLLSLRIPGHQWLKNLNIQDFETILSVVKDSILATDLDLYNKRRDTFFSTVEKLGPVKYLSSAQNLKQLRRMLMVACDLNRLARSWDVEKRACDQLSEDYLSIQQFSDKNYPSFPEAEAKFIDEYGLPLFKKLAELSDALHPLYQNVLRNKENWTSISNMKPDIISE